jgi:hypothetical protein
MTKRFLSSLPILVIASAMLSACGGGGGGTAVVPQMPTTATISISTSGTLDPNTMIAGIPVTVILPEGVTVKTTPDLSNPSMLVTSPGVVVASGVTGTNALVGSIYNAADRKVIISVVDPYGFGTGKFVTMHCNIVSATTPTAGAFALADFSPYDTNGANIPGLTAGFTVDIQ